MANAQIGNDHSPKRSHLLAVVAAAAGLMAALPATSETLGLRVLAQPWNPLTNDDQVVRLIDDASLISREFDAGWDRVAPQAKQRLEHDLSNVQLPNGLGLYDVVVDLPRPELGLAAPPGRAPQTIAASVRLTGLKITATSRLPGPQGKYADPRCSARADVEATFRVTLADRLPNLLSTDMNARRGDRPFRLSNFVADGDNAVCDAVVGALKLVGLDDDLAQAVEKLPNNSAFRATVINGFKGVLDSANAKLAGAPSGLLRLNTWVTGRPGQHLLTVYLAPLTPLPNVGPRTTLTGRFVNAATGAPQASLDCSALGMTLRRVTGPRPVLNPAGTLGDWPTEPLPLTLECPAAPLGGSAPFRVAGMPPFPILVSFKPLPAGPCRGDGVLRMASVVTTEADWPDRNGALTPADFGRPLTLTARLMRDMPCGIQNSDNRNSKPGPVGPTEAWRPDRIGPVSDTRRATDFVSASGVSGLGPLIGPASDNRAATNRVLSTPGTAAMARRMAPTTKPAAPLAAKRPTAASKLILKPAEEGPR